VGGTGLPSDTHALIPRPSAEIVAAGPLTTVEPSDVDDAVPVEKTEKVEYTRNGDSSSCYAYARAHVSSTVQPELTIQELVNLSDLARESSVSLVHPLITVPRLTP
jgi:hypothetical protein